MMHYSAVITTSDGAFVAQMSWTGDYAAGLEQVRSIYGNPLHYVITLHTVEV